MSERVLRVCLFPKGKCEEVAKGTDHARSPESAAAASGEGPGLLDTSVSREPVAGGGEAGSYPQFCRTLVRTASCLFQGFFPQKPGNLYTPFSKQECSISVAAFSSVAVTVSSLF